LGGAGEVFAVADGEVEVGHHHCCGCGCVSAKALIWNRVGGFLVRSELVMNEIC
jgi:hypothetical protein